MAVCPDTAVAEIEGAEERVRWCVDADQYGCRLPQGPSDGVRVAIRVADRVEGRVLDPCRRVHARIGLDRLRESALGRSVVAVARVRRRQGMTSCVERSGERDGCVTGPDGARSKRRAIECVDDGHRPAGHGRGRHGRRDRDRLRRQGRVVVRREHHLGRDTDLDAFGCALARLPVGEWTEAGLDGVRSGGEGQLERRVTIRVQGRWQPATSVDDEQDAREEPVRRLWRRCDVRRHRERVVLGARRHIQRRRRRRSGLGRGRRGEARDEDGDHEHRVSHQFPFASAHAYGLPGAYAPSIPFVHPWRRRDSSAVTGRGRTVHVACRPAVAKERPAAASVPVGDPPERKVDAVGAELQPAGPIRPDHVQRSARDQDVAAVR